MQQRPKQLNADAQTGSLFEYPQQRSESNHNGYIVDSLDSRKTLVGKGTLSMPIQRYPDKSADNPIPSLEPVLAVLDDPDANANITSLFDLLLRIDKRNHPELYD